MARRKFGPQRIDDHLEGDGREGHQGLVNDFATLHLCEANMVAVDGNADVVLLVEALLSR